MSISRRLDELKVSLVGNRVTFASRAALSMGIIAGAYAIKDPSNDVSVLPSVILTVSGLVGEFATLGGRKTRELYCATRDHIEDFGYLEERFVEGIVGDPRAGRLFGYCENQGIYLAARELGYLKTFSRAKKRLSRNVIPNF